MNQESVGLGLGFRVPGKVPKIVQVVSRVGSAADGSQADALYRRPASLMSLLFRMHAPASRACRCLLLGQRSLQRFDVYNRTDHGAASQVAAPHCAPAQHQLVSLAPAIILGPESAAGLGSRKIGLVGAARSCELTLYWCWPDQKTALDPENDEGRPPGSNLCVLPPWTILAPPMRLSAAQLGARPPSEQAAGCVTAEAPTVQPRDTQATSGAQCLTDGLSDSCSV